MGFEEDIRSRMPGVVARQRDIEQAEQARQASLRAGVTVERRRDEAVGRHALELGRQAAAMLRRSGAQLLPILERVEFGPEHVRTYGTKSGQRTVSERDTSIRPTGQGWHLATTHQPGDIEIPRSWQYLALADDGRFGVFWKRILPNYRDEETRRTVDLNGIIFPEFGGSHERRLQVMESDLFKDAVAYMLATGNTYEVTDYASL